VYCGEVEFFKKPWEELSPEEREARGKWVHSELARYQAEDDAWKDEMDRQTILESERRHELEDVNGAAGRYEVRKKWFQNDGEPNPKLRHQAFWFIHNCVAHPMLGLFPNRQAVQFHSLTSSWLNKERVEISDSDRYPIQAPKIPNKKAWILHNVVAHVAIGLWPSEWTFRFHDESAEKMKVPGWV